MRLHPLDSDVAFLGRIRKLHREKEELIEIINELTPYTLIDSIAAQDRYFTEKLPPSNDDNESDQQ